MSAEIDWERRIALAEDSTLEFKRIVMRDATSVAGPHPDGMSDELAAFANARGGTLLLGIDDKTRAVIGIEWQSIDAVEHWLVSICQDRIAPPLDVHTEHVELPDPTGSLRPVIVVEVPRSLFVHQSANGYFKRVGNSKKQMRPDELARLFQQRSQTRLIRFEEQAVADTRFDDVDAMLARDFVRDGEGPVEMQLRHLHLLTDDHGEVAMTVAGVLLTSATPTRWLPAAYIQAVAYRGLVNDPEDQVDAKDFMGPIQQQIWDAFDFVRLHNRVAASKDLGRIDHPAYSLRAIFEAIVNAVAHRDYSLATSRIRLHLFKDRLELHSPGVLPNSLTIEAMASVSIPRNEVITNAFARYFPMRESGLGRQFLMDRRGAGVDIVLRESERLSGRRPLYETIAELELRLTIYAAALPEDNE